MTPEPQRNDAPVSGVPLSVIIDTLRERLKQSRANLEQANRALDERIAERDEARAQLAAVPIFSFATDQIRDLEAQLTAALAQADALRKERDEAVATLAQITPLKNSDIRLVISLTEEALALRTRCAELETALVRLRDCDFVITPHDRMDAVRDIAHAALRDTSAPQQHAPDAQTP